MAISSNLQIRLPIAAARALNLQGGDTIYWRLSDDNPGVLELVPSEVVERRYSAGERRERLARTKAEELDALDVPTSDQQDA